MKYAVSIVAVRRGDEKIFNFLGFLTRDSEGEALEAAWAFARHAYPGRQYQATSVHVCPEDRAEMDPDDPRIEDCD